MRSIVYDVIRQKVYHREVALKYGIKTNLVAWIIRKAKINPEFFNEMERKQLEKMADQKAVITTAQELMTSGDNLWNIRQLKAKIEQPLGKLLTDKFVGNVLKYSMNLRYKRVKMIAWKGNSERCLVLRQLCAKYLLEEMSNGAIMVSVDQSWLSNMGYRRMKWRARNDTNGVTVKQMTTKVNLIGACDSEGGVYNACNQTNTTSKVMILYL